MPDVGDVLFTRSYRAKHIVISVKPSLKIRVSVPVGVKFDKVHRITEKRTDWIKKKLRKHSLSKAKNLFKELDGNELSVKMKYLQNRVSYLANCYGFQYKKVSFRKMFTRWGSCSAKNNISLNILMTQIPEELQDYIILHELLHTKIKNHSKGYWAELDILTGDAKGTQKILKENYTLYN